MLGSRFPAPTKLWPFNYITGAWKDYIVTRGVGKDRAKRFLADEWLVNGSEHGGIETHWSDPHEFWEAAIATTSQKGFFFSGEAVDELCNMLAEQCEQVQKPSIKPGQSVSPLVYTLAWSPDGTQQILRQRQEPSCGDGHRAG